MNQLKSSNRVVVKLSSITTKFEKIISSVSIKINKKIHLLKNLFRNLILKTKNRFKTNYSKFYQRSPTN